MSRNRESSHIFELFMEISPPKSSKEDGEILMSYPELKTVDAQLYKAAPNFTYPFNMEINKSINYCYVLTQADSSFLYGFVRKQPALINSLVIVSRYPLYEVFYELLKDISDLILKSHNRPSLNNLREEPVMKMMKRYYSVKLSSAHLHNHQLMTLPQSYNLVQYLNSFEKQGMISLLAALLAERRIIVSSNDVEKLTSIVHAMRTLLAPLDWQSVFIPLLPYNLYDCLFAPMPYIIGVHCSSLKKSGDFHECVHVNVDSGDVCNPHGDHFPPTLNSMLLQDLGSVFERPEGGGLKRTFMKALSYLLGGVTDSFKLIVDNHKQCLEFDEETFIHTRSSSDRTYLTSLIQSQMFIEYVNIKRDKLCSPSSFDEFDELCSLWGKPKKGFAKHAVLLKNFKSKVAESNKVVVNKYHGIVKKMNQTVISSSPRDTAQSQWFHPQPSPYKGESSYSDIKRQNASGASLRSYTTPRIIYKKPTINYLLPEASLIEQVLDLRPSLEPVASSVSTNAHSISPLVLAGMVDGDGETASGANTKTDDELLLDYGIDIEKLEITRRGWTTFE